MKAPVKLAIYAATLAVLFAASFGIARAITPASVVEDWNKRATPQHSMSSDPAAEKEGEDGHR